MNTIYKFILMPPVGSLMELSLPAEAKLLSVHEEHGALYLWALVDLSAPLENRKLRVIGTGHPIDFDAYNARFIGTAFVGEYVWHVFEEIDLGYEPRH